VAAHLLESYYVVDVFNKSNEGKLITTSNSKENDD
jgi:hypothetical protein